MPFNHLTPNRFCFSAVLLTFLIQATLISSVYADVPPPEDYQETCTVEIQSENGDECISCSAYREMNDCESTYGAEGYTKNCQSWGATVWTEVWCKASPNSVEGTGGMNAEETGGMNAEETGGANTEESETASDNEDSDSCAQSAQSPITFALLFMLLTLIIRPRLRSTLDK